MASSAGKAGNLRRKRYLGIALGTVTRSLEGTWRQYRRTDFIGVRETCKSKAGRHRQRASVTASGTIFPTRCGAYSRRGSRRGRQALESIRTGRTGRVDSRIHPAVRIAGWYRAL